MSAKRHKRPALLPPYTGVLDEALPWPLTDTRMEQHLRRERLANRRSRSAGPSRERRPVDQDDADLRDRFVEKTVETIRNIDRIRQGEFRTQLETWDKKYSYLLKRAEIIYQKKQTQLARYNNREMQRELIKENLSQFPKLPAPEPMPRHPDVVPRPPSKPRPKTAQSIPLGRRPIKASTAPTESVASDTRSTARSISTDFQKQLSELIHRINVIEGQLRTMPHTGDNTVAIFTLETNFSVVNVTLRELGEKLDALEARTDAHDEHIESLESSDQGRTKAIERPENGVKQFEDRLGQVPAVLTQREASSSSPENKQADPLLSVDHSPRHVRTSTSGSNPKKEQSDQPPSGIRSRRPRGVSTSGSNPKKGQLDSPPPDVHSREPVLNDSIQSIPETDRPASADYPHRSMHTVDTKSNPKTDQSDPSLPFEYPRKGKLNDTTESDPEDARSSSVGYSRTSKRNHGSNSSPEKNQPLSTDKPTSETTVVQKTETSPERSPSKCRSPIQHDEHSQTTGDAVDLTWLKSFTALQQDHNRLAKDHTSTQHTVQNHGESLQNLADRCNQLDGRLALVEAKQKRPENTSDGQDRTLFEADAELTDPNQPIDSSPVPSPEDTPLLTRNRSPVTNSPSPPATRSDEQSELTKQSPTESKATMTDLPAPNPRQLDEPKSQLNEKDHSNDAKTLAPLERPEGQPQSSLDDNKALQDQLNKLEERVQQLEGKHERDINELRSEFDEKLEKRMKDLQEKLDKLLSPMNGFKPSPSPTPSPPSVSQLQAKGKIPFIEFAPPIDLFTNEDTFGL